MPNPSFPDSQKTKNKKSNYKISVNIDKGSQFFLCIFLCPNSAFTEVYYAFIIRLIIDDFFYLMNKARWTWGRKTNGILICSPLLYVYSNTLKASLSLSISLSLSLFFSLSLVLSLSLSLTHTHTHTHTHKPVHAQNTFSIASSLKISIQTEIKMWECKCAACVCMCIFALNLAIDLQYVCALNLWSLLLYMLT